MKKPKIIIVIIVCILLAIAIGIGISLNKLFSFDSTPDIAVINDFRANKADFIEAKDYILSNNSIEKLFPDSYAKEQKSLKQIFEVLKYKGIFKANDNNVYFLRVSEFEFTQGILFSSTGIEPSGPYITQVTKIEDGWFLYKSK